MLMGVCCEEHGTEVLPVVQTSFPSKDNVFLSPRTPERKTQVGVDPLFACTSGSALQGEFPYPSGFNTSLEWTSGNNVSTPFDGQWCSDWPGKLDRNWRDLGLQQLSPNDHGYDKAFDALACGRAADPSWLWGDNGPNVPGYGGINSFAVVKVIADEFRLYGARAAFGTNITEDINRPWFIDESVLSDSPNLSTYQNDKVATCFDWTWWVSCQVKKGAIMVVGSGAPRNCSINASPVFPGYLNTPGNSCSNISEDGQSFCSEYNPAIKEYQEVDATILQYVMPPMTEDDENIVSCTACKIDVNDVARSCETNPETKKIFEPDSWPTTVTKTPKGIGKDKTCPKQFVQEKRRSR